MFNICKYSNHLPATEVMFSKVVSNAITTLIPNNKYGAVGVEAAVFPCDIYVFIP
jgi:hypothetical protein